VDSWDRTCARFAGDHGGGVELLSPVSPNLTTPTVLVADTGNNKIRAVSIDSNERHCISSMNCPICGDGFVQIGGVDAGFEACDAQSPLSQIEGCSYYCRVLPGYVCDWDLIGNLACSEKSLLSTVNFMVYSEAICQSKCDATLNCVHVSYSHSSRTCELHSNACQYEKTPTGYQTWVRSAKTSRCSSVCGDGIRRFAYEQCDDQNLAIDDGCSETCTVEDGWHCQGGSMAPTQHAEAWKDVCTPICGDKLRVGTELDKLSCDHGNRDDLDGCSAACRIEVPSRVDDIDITRLKATQARVQWKHMPLAVAAKETNDVHRVYYYVATVNRTLCRAGRCRESVTNYTFNYSTCPYEVQLRPEPTPANAAWACEQTCRGMPGLCIFSKYSSSGRIQYDVNDFAPICTLYLYECALEPVQDTFGKQVQASCDDKYCSFYQNDLMPGEFLNVTIVSVNIAGFSSPRKSGMRWTVVPTADLRFDYTEIPVARSDFPRDGFQIALFWHPPSDTGWGDSASLPILEYRIEVSLCESFNDDDILCGPTWVQNFIPGTFVVGTTIDPKTVGIKTSSGLEQTICFRGEWERWYDCIGQDEKIPFAYPFQLNVTFDLHNGFPYFYRFMSRNKQGWSQYSMPVLHQYGKLPFATPFVDAPALLPIPAAVVLSESGRLLHLWSNRESIDQETLLHISGFPDIRGVEGLELRFDLLGFAETGRVRSVKGSSVATGTTISYQAPVISAELMETCKDLCLATVTVILKRWNAKFAQFRLRYFNYPKTIVEAVKPTLGPVSGGTIMKIVLVEPLGPLTRQGSGLESFSLALDRQLPISVQFGCFSSLNVANRVTVKKTVGTEDLKTVNSFELSITIPASTNGPCSADLRVYINNVRFLDFQLQNLKLAFEYVGTKIMSVVPPNGMLNPGSGGATVTLTLSNLANSRITTTLAGLPCENEQKARWDSDAGTSVSYSVKFPEMPLERAGAVLFRITWGSGFGSENLDFMWQYERPPATYIDKDSIAFDGEKRLWLPAGRQKFACKLIVRNLSPKYAIKFDDIQVSVGDFNSSNPKFFRVGDDVQISFLTSNSTIPSQSKLVVTSKEKGIVTSTTQEFDDNLPAVIEFKDASQPTLVALAPSEGPSTGGTVIRIGVASLPQYLTEPQELRVSCAFLSHSGLTMPSATVLSQMSLAKWLDGGVDSVEFVTTPQVGRFLAGMSSEISVQYAEVIDQTRKYAKTYGKANALENSYVFHVLAPFPPVHVGNSQKYEISLGIGNLTIIGQYVYHPDPVGHAVIKVATASGKMESGLDGGVRITVSLTNFAMVDTINDVYVKFGVKEMSPFKIAESSVHETQLVIVAPPAGAGTVEVILYPTRLSSNSASFQFKYADDRKPIILSLSPHLHYEAGGSVMHIRIKGLVFDDPSGDVTREINVGVQSGGELTPVFHPFSALVDFDVVELSILVPRGIKGTATVVVSVGPKTSAPTNFVYVSEPTGIPHIASISPGTLRSSGRDSMEIIMENIKMIENISSLRITFTMDSTLVGITSESNLELQMFSQCAQTRVSLLSPVFQSGGTVSIRIWELGREDKTASADLVVENSMQAKLVSVYPSRSITSGSHTVDVVIRNFGSVSYKNVFVKLNEPAEGSGVVEEYSITSQIDNVDLVTLKISILVLRQVFVPFDVTVGNCRLFGECPLKTVKFAVHLKDPSGVFVISAAPLSTSLDGNILMTIVVNNLEKNLEPKDLSVMFGLKGVGEVLLVEYGNDRLKTDASTSRETSVTCVVPPSEAAITLTPRLQYRSSSLDFPDEFRYTAAVQPSIRSIAPMSAKLSAPSMINITVQALPGIKAITDIVVEIRCSRGTSTSCSVRSYSRVDPSKYLLAAQDYIITAEVPSGGVLKQDTCQVVLYNTRFRSKEASLMGFTVVDEDLPQVSGISSEFQDTGVNSIRAKMSMTTELRVVLRNTPRAVAKVLIEEQKVETKLVYYDKSDKSGVVIFSSPTRAFEGNVYGLLLFSSGCVCDTSCCGSFTCSSCTCQTTCFSIEYYDDLLPRILYLSSSTGPSVGGTSIILKIVRFPIVQKSTDVMAKFSTALGKVGVVSSGLGETNLIVQSPSIDMRGLISQTLDVQLYAVSQPDRVITFKYMYFVAEASLKMFSPSTGYATGGTRTQVTIDYFVFPTEVAVIFGSIRIPADNISMSDASNLGRTMFSFLTPPASPNQYVVKFIPKSCSTCEPLVTANFEVKDSKTLTILPPMPTRGPYRPASPLPQTLRISGADLNTSIFNISLTFSLVADPGNIMKATILSYEVRADLDEYLIRFQTESLSSPGIATAKLVIASASGVSMAEFAYLFVSDEVMSVRALQPSALPTSAMLYGRILEFSVTCQFVVSSFPRQHPLSDLSILLASDKDVTIIDMQHFDVACQASPKNKSCSETIVTARVPSHESATSIQGTLSAVGQELVGFTLEYFTPCAYEVFCGDLFLIVDVQRLTEVAPLSSTCQVHYCVDPNLLPAPSVLSFSPSAGPSVGGTTVNVTLRNFPAFRKSDIAVQVGRGSSTVMQGVESFVLQPGSTLLTSECTITFKTPSVKGRSTKMNLLEPVVISMNWGAFQQETFFAFEFIPVMIGTPTISVVEPKEIVQNVGTEIRVRMSNFPSIPAGTGLIPVHVEVDTPGNHVLNQIIMLSSTYESTLLGLRLTIGHVGNAKVTLYHTASGAGSAVSFDVVITPARLPQVATFFPAKVLAGKSQQLLISITSLPLTITPSSLAVFIFFEVQKLVVRNVSVEDIRTQGPGFHSVTLTIPGKEIPLSGGPAKVLFETGSIRFDFRIDFDASATPQVAGVSPSSLSVSASSGESSIHVYFSNAASLSCVAGCTVTFGEDYGTVIGTSIINGLAHVELRAPSQKSNGMQEVRLRSNLPEVVFAFSFTLPEARLEPVDGTCNGASSVTITALGWGATLTNLTNLTVRFNNQPAIVSKVMHSSNADSTGSETCVVVKVPDLGIERGLVFGVIQYNDKVSDFKFECYAAVSGFVFPAKATTQGKTTHKDGDRVDLWLSNFPHVSKPSDVGIRFGNIRCDGLGCAILAVQNSVRGVQITVSVPANPYVGEVDLDIFYAGLCGSFIKYVNNLQAHNLQLQSNARCSERRVSMKFNYFLPTPTLLRAHWCKDCPASGNCIQNDRCTAGHEPILHAVPASGSGTLALVIQDIAAVGVEDALPVPSARIEIKFNGEYFGNLRRVVYSSQAASSFEFEVPSELPVGDTEVEVTVTPDRSISFFQRFVFALQVFDDNVVFGCENPSGCTGNVVGGSKFITILKNFALSMMEGLEVRFGSIIAKDVTVLDANTTHTRLSLVAPSFDCPLCQMSGGIATVMLSVNVGALRIAHTIYRYRSPPRLFAAVFDSSMMSLQVSFDQPTNRAGVRDVNDFACQVLFAQRTLDRLGAMARCVWQSKSTLVVLLDTDASIVPGELLSVNSTNLNSEDDRTGSVESWIPVSKPAVMKAPSVMIVGPSRVDECSSIYLRSAASSARRVFYTWRCPNDPTTDNFLRTINGSAVFMPEGTPWFPESEKSYQIVLTVTDSFGVESEPYVFSIFKTRSPTPNLEFIPSTLTVFPDQEVQIRAEATFSSCPAPRSDLIFSWKQKSGPPIPVQFLGSSTPRLYLPSNVLEPGSVFELVCSVSMMGQATIDNVVVLRTDIRPLLAKISGAPEKYASARVELTLSAEESLDPNMKDASNRAGIVYKWSCDMFESTVFVPCRTTSGGILALSSSSRLQLPAHTLLPMDQKYIFTVEVWKKGRASSSAQVSVRILPDAVPSMDLTVISGGSMVGGVLYINPVGTISINSSSSAIRTSFEWVLEPVWHAERSEVAKSGLNSHFLVLDGPFTHLAPGSRYSIKVLGKSANSTTGMATLVVQMNAPPSHGDFSACRKEAAASTCVSTGKAILDSFRLSCDGWIDSDLPLTFIFGYSLASSNASAAASSDYWWEPMLDFARDAVFPSGSVITKVRIVDVLGAESDVLTRNLFVTPTASQPVGRRLLSTRSPFYQGAMDKVSDALRTSRADQVNQLAGAIAVEAQQVIAGDEAISLRSDLMSSLVDSTDKTIKTLAYACEAFGAAVLVLNATHQLDHKAILDSGNLLGKLVLDVTHQQAVDSACATSAATMMGCAMQAQSSRSDILWANSSVVPELSNRSVHILNEEEGNALMQNIEHGSTELMTKVIWNSLAGGPVRNIFANASRHTMTRARLKDLAERTFTQPSPLYDSILQPAAVTFPATIAVDLPMLSYGEVDVHLQGHSHAPAAKGLWIRSHLFGITLARPRGGSVLNVSNLSSPVKLFLPVHTYRMSAREQMLFVQQARCVYWAGNAYQSTGCNVTAVDGHTPSQASWPKVLPLSLVTVESRHLTIFAVTQDYLAPACGDGILQVTGGGIVQSNEECDDEDISSGDGCSSTCTVEANYSCFDVPSVCVAHPAPFGIQGIVGLRDFYSMREFTMYVDEFAEAIANAIGFEIQTKDVSTFNICFRGVCRTYFDVHADPEKMRRLGFSAGNLNQVTVYFQVNAPQKDRKYMDILSKMRSYAYMPAFLAQFFLLTGKNARYEWLQPPALLDPKYAPGWKDPQPVPGFPAPKDDDGLYEPGSELGKLDWFQKMASTFGVSLGFFIFLFIMMILVSVGSLCAFRLYYRKKAEQFVASKKIAPSPMQPGSPQTRPETPEAEPVVFLQDGIQDVPQDAILDTGWGARSFINQETVAEIGEEVIEPAILPKPAPPPPLPPGKMKRPQISTPDLKKLRANADLVSRELETLVAHNDDSSRGAMRSSESDTTTTASVGTDQELLQALGFAAPPPPAGRLNTATRPRSPFGDQEKAVEISSGPVVNQFKRSKPGAAQSKIAQLKQELDRLMQEDYDEAERFDPAEANRSALSASRTDVGQSREGPDDGSIQKDAENDRNLFSGTRNYASLRGRFQIREGWRTVAGLENYEQARISHENDDIPYTPVRPATFSHTSPTAVRPPTNYGEARIFDEVDDVPYTLVRPATISLSSSTAVRPPASAPSHEVRSPLVSRGIRPALDGTMHSIRAPSTVAESPDPWNGSPEPWTPGIASLPRPLFSRQVPMTDSPDPGDSSPEPWTPSTSSLPRTIFSRQVPQSSFGHQTDFSRRANREAALQGSLRPATVGASRAGLEVPRRPPPVAVDPPQIGWGDDADDMAAGVPYMRTRPTTALSPLSPRPVGLPVRAQSPLAAAARAEALFQLSTPLDLRTSAGRWATASDSSSHERRQPVTSHGKKRANNSDEALSSASPRSPSRLLDDKLIDEEDKLM
jgi:cysteine-rich repeat protein